MSKPVFVGGNLQEILGDGIPPPDFLLQNCAPSIASIVTAELFEVKTMELIKPQGWGGGIPEAKAIRMARDDDFCSLAGGVSGGYTPPNRF